MAIQKTQVTLPEIGMLAVTRVLLGVGLGFLLSDLLSKDQRKTLGWALFGVGVVSTVPLAVEVLGGKRDDIQFDAAA